MRRKANVSPSQGSVRNRLSETQARGSEVELFDAIVKGMPQEIEAFFEMFDKARGNLTLPQEVSVLNAVARGEFTSARGTGTATCLMRWFEVFRDIYIANRLVREREERAPGKNPDAFTTFARTFEPLAMLPDFWFANERLARGKHVRDLAHPVRLAFERYMYSCAGGGAWGAMDWEMWRYVQMRIFEPLRRGPAAPLRRLAALALTFRGIVIGELGLHIEERDDVTLQLTGLSNAARQKIPLLKYYHYDRFTQLSFTREHEFAMDPSASGDHMAFEERWLGLAVISDFILKESNAHSTLAAATRVALESFSRCISRTAAKVGRNAPQELVSALERLSDDVDTPAVMRAPCFKDENVLLEHVGVKESVMSADHYLVVAGLDTAGKFWRQILPIFKELRLRFMSCRESTVASFTQKQMSQVLAHGRDVQVEYLREVINFGNGGELLSSFGGGGLRGMLKACLSGNEFELQYGVAADVLLGDGCKKGTFSVLSLFTQQGCSIPMETLFGRGRNLQFEEWILDMWTQRSAAGGTNGRDYTRIDFRNVVKDADRLWNCYFLNGSEIEDRWKISLHVAMRTFKEMLANGQVRFTMANGGYSRIWSEQEIRRMLARLEQERLLFVNKGTWEDDVAVLNSRVSAQVENTLSTVCGKGDARIFAIYAVLARLMVVTARDCPGVWANRSELFSLVSHLLCATSHNLAVAFPWHLGIFNDSHLRLGRTHSRQQNVVDQIVDHEYGDAVEQQVLLMFLAHYLKESPAPCDVLDAIDGNERLCGYFGACRIRFLKSYFE